MNNLHVKLRFFNQGQSSSIKVNQGVFSIYRARHSITPIPYHFTQDSPQLALSSILSAFVLTSAEALASQEPIRDSLPPLARAAAVPCQRDPPLAGSLPGPKGEL